MRQSQKAHAKLSCKSEGSKQQKTIFRDDLHCGS